MVDISEKPATSRAARAVALVRMSGDARDALTRATLAKGDAFATAQVAGIMAAKQTPALIPLAHAVPLGAVDIAFEWMPDGALRIEAVARTTAQTGVEMEALVGATVAALTIYDMTKAVDKSVSIEHVGLMEKSGGKSGTWKRPA